MSHPTSVSLPGSPGWSRWIDRLRAATAGRFTILRELGRGGFAAVFLAQQQQPNRRVAIKLLLPAHLDSEWAREHFRGESQKIAEWRHQSVVTIYEVHEVDDLFFFVMSYVEGGSLHEILTAFGPLPIPVVQSVLAQTGSALQYAHARGVTHRDIKPHNVLVDTEGLAVVTDFGIAKQAGGPSHTQTGMIFGTAPYMAPEQCEHGTTSIFSDQYSLGIMAYEMLIGQPPFTGAVTGVMLAHIQKPVPSIREQRPDCPPELEAAIMRMLAKKPEDRFPSIAEAMFAAGAVELPVFSPERRQLAQAASDMAQRAQATQLDVVSIPPFLEVGDKVPLEAAARSNSGVLISSADIKWAVDDQALAQLDEKARELTAKAPGTATVIVRSGTIEQQVRVDIRPPQPANIELSLPPQPLAAGATGQFAGVVRSKNGIPVPSQISWRSDNPQVLTIDATGRFTARGAGQVRVEARVGDVVRESIVEVLPQPIAEVRISGSASTITMGEKLKLTAVVLDESDQERSDVAVQWSSSDRKVATVSPDGTVSASTPGTVTITAAIDGKTAAVSILVQEPQAAVIELSPPPTFTYVGDTVRMRAVARDSAGRPIERKVLWTSDDDAVATVGADGTLVARGAGTAVVSATLDGVAAATVVEIRARAVVDTSAPMQATAIFTGSPVKAEAPAVSPVVPPVAAPAEAPVAPAARTVDAPAAASAGKHAERPAPAPVAEPSAPTPSSGGLPKGALIAAGVAAVAVIGFFATRGGDASPDTQTAAPVADAAGAAPTGTPAAPPAPPSAAPPTVESTAPASPAPATASTPAAPAGRALTIAGARDLAAGDSVRLSLRGNADGTVRWRSTDATVLSVSTRGVATARKAGSARIIVSAGDQADTVAITVSARAATVASKPEPAAAEPARPATASAAPATTPTPSAPAPAPVREAPAADAGPSDDVLIRQLVNRYAVALSNKQLDEAVSLAPGLSDKARKGYRDFFKSNPTWKVEYNLGAIDAAQGTVKVTGQHRFVAPDGKSMCLPVNFQFKAAKQDGGWRLIQVPDLKGNVQPC